MIKYVLNLSQDGHNIFQVIHLTLDTCIYFPVFDPLVFGLWCVSLNPKKSKVNLVDSGIKRKIFHKII